MLPVSLSGIGVTSEKNNLKSIQKLWWEGQWDPLPQGSVWDVVPLGTGTGPSPGPWDDAPAPSMWTEG